MQAFDRLSSRYNPIVIEGAGSISELNLKAKDIVNLRVAIRQKAATFLIADIDRGGVFASLYGTMQLLDEEERRCIKGIIINKFRGDISLFDEGRKMIEELCGVPVLGVIPAYKDIHIEEEDSLSKSIQNQQVYVDGKVNIAVVLLRRLSNFTDFNRLEHDERVNLFYSHNSKELENADIIIIPGTKSTLSDLLELRKFGIAQTIVRLARAGKTVIGICGGYQMMGEELCDPAGHESEIAVVPGLGLLPIATIMAEEKTTKQVSFLYKGKTKAQGYEIHMGESRRVGQGTKSLNQISASRSEGCWQSDCCWGTYMHGILDNDEVIDDLLSPFETARKQARGNYADFKQAQYDKLALHVRENINMDLFYKLII